MKFAVFATTLLAAVGIAAAAPAVDKQKRSIDVEIFYVGDEADFSFGQCFPFQKNGEPIQRGMVTENARCGIFTDSNCLNPAVPSWVPALAEVGIPNVANLAEILGGSGSCEALL